jgi:hypothetical protein
LIQPGKHESDIFTGRVEPASANCYPSLHSDKYNFTDDALAVAMRMFGELVMNWKK